MNKKNYFSKLDDKIREQKFQFNYFLIRVNCFSPPTPLKKFHCLVHKMVVHLSPPRGIVEIDLKTFFLSLDVRLLIQFLKYTTHTQCNRINVP